MWEEDVYLLAGVERTEHREVAQHGLVIVNYTLTSSRVKSIAITERARGLSFRCIRAYRLESASRHYRYSWGK